MNIYKLPFKTKTTMGILNRLFSKKEKKVLQDGDLGQFNELNHNEDKFIWQGQVKIFDKIISLYMSGNSTELNSGEKLILLDIMKNETAIEIEISKAFQEQYKDANKPFSTWQNHFKCIAMYTMYDESYITFEENETFNHFNVFLLDSKVTGVSIDS